MSAYFKQKKGWRYDFRIQGQRYTGAWFPTKRAALDAEAERRKKPREEQGEQPAVATLQAVPVPPGGEPIPPIQTVTDFLTLTNARLDSIRSRRRERHYKEVCRYAKGWIREWGSLPCTEVTTRMIETFVDRIAQSSTCVANRNLLLLSAVFRYGIKKGLLRENPAAGIERYPEKEADVYVPPTEDVERVLRVAAPEQRDYLEVMWGTLGRMGEINRLEWADVDFAHRRVTLYTRKKKDGSRRPRKVPMTDTVYEVLTRLHARRDPKMPWVFWHTYWSRTDGRLKTGPYEDRKKMMRTLCAKAGVQYFRYHALRHSGALLLDEAGVRLTEIQLILGHENLTTTQIYLRKLRGPEAESIAGHERARRKSHTEAHTTNEKGPGRLPNPLI